MNGTLSPYFYYWGKARPRAGEASIYHPFPYHCLDVASVAAAWWRRSKVIRQSFCHEMECREAEARAWVLFFIAMHDYGKLDIRFQLKAPQALQLLRPSFNEDDVFLDGQYSHGPAGFGLFFQFDCEHLQFDMERLDAWRDWLAAVAGHHGNLPQSSSHNEPMAAEPVLSFDREARIHWVGDLEELYLMPAGLGLSDTPPPCPDTLAGFCAICDWLGSDSEVFNYRPLKENASLDSYWREVQDRSQRLLEESGLVREACLEFGMSHLFPDYKPRQLQTVVDQLPVEPALMIVEAPTGSGKTEAALAQASRLLASGIAESVIFALPTQATSNAMFARLEEVAGKLFRGGANLLLAHGKAKYHDGFAQLKRVSSMPTAQGEEDASVQCVRWLGGSRKRVFLGQVGVCTIDQVLMSVLPAKHQFVRAFGLRKSVLIVDEVHAYDAYMYGLLRHVLEGQYAAGAPTLLLSATLPAHQKSMLLSTWGADVGSLPSQESPYPLVTAVSVDGKVSLFQPEAGQRPDQFKVTTETWESPSLLPDEWQSRAIIEAAETGALVGIVCNLVSDAQSLYLKLKSMTTVPVELFHARYRFADRQTHESQVLQNYGKEASRQGGRILVATQVIEQSLDLDFDWLLTQICPVDLLFQRLGRLHRHSRNNRPVGFANPKVTILVPHDLDFGLHSVVYGCRRFLWRTSELLKGNENVTFPDFYRPWIERVYDVDPWPDEPEEICKEFEDFSSDEQGRYYCASRLSKSSATPWEDTEGVAARLTRDGDMNLSVVLIQRKGGGKLALLDGRDLDLLPEEERDEALDLNTVGVPASWGKVLPRTDDEGRVWLEMIQLDGKWSHEGDAARFWYDDSFGLVRER